MGKTSVWMEEMAEDVAAMRRLFSKVDELVIKFLEHHAQKIDSPIEGQFGGQKFSETPLWLFTHTVTHEFHHKGQIATMGRMKGYVPPDLDLITADGSGC